MAETVWAKLRRFSHAITFTSSKYHISSIRVWFWAIRAHETGGSDNPFAEYNKALWKLPMPRSCDTAARFVSFLDVMYVSINLCIFGGLTPSLFIFTGSFQNWCCQYEKNPYFVVKNAYLSPSNFSAASLHVTSLYVALIKDWAGFSRRHSIAPLSLSTWRVAYAGTKSLHICSGSCDSDLCHRSSISWGGSLL